MECSGRCGDEEEVRSHLPIACTTCKGTGLNGRIYALRKSIDDEFNQVRSLADGVLFEFGPSRQRDLEIRDDILKYRFQVPGFELPEAMRLGQQAYDDRSAQMLDEMAERIESSVPQAGSPSEVAFDLLEKTIQAYYQESQQPPAAHVWSFTTLLRGIDSLTTSLAAEIAAKIDRAE